MGWYNESSRHSLASRGIRTKAILNPVASLKWKEKYDDYPYHGTREFVGSGLEGLTREQIVDWAKMFAERINQIGREEEKYSDDLDVKVEAVWIVGSRAAGFYDKYSDIDMVILFHGIPLYHVWEVENVIDNFVEEWYARDWVDNFLVDDEGKRIFIDVVGWSDTYGPDEDEPQLLIWEAS